MFQALINDTIAAAPLLLWVAVGLLVLCVQIVSRSSWLSLLAALFGLLGTLVYSICHFDPSAAHEVFHGTVLIDSFAQIFNLLSLGVVLAVLLMSIPGIYNGTKAFRDNYEQFPEFLICLTLSGFGVGVLASAVDLTSLFLGLEILSIGIYCLCGFYRTELNSTESAFKYLMIGAFSTALFLYGVAFIYGASGATQYAAIYKILQAKAFDPLLILGTLFLVAGFSFKLALVPFHLYTPDVYEGAPTPVTGYLATIVKIGAIAGGVRVFWGFLEPHAATWVPVWLGLCGLSIIVGNVVALQQTTVKRMLAFSSISHAGFIGLGLVIANPLVGDMFPVISYLAVYSAMTIGAFAFLTLIEDRDHPLLVEDLKGLGQKRFLLSALFAVFLLGMAGLPPFAGFMIKFWILQGLIEQHYYWIAGLAVLGSLIGAAYYLRLLMLLFMAEGQGSSTRWQGAQDTVYSLRLVLGLTALITLIGGLKPQIYADWFLSALALK